MRIFTPYILAALTILIVAGCATTRPHWIPPNERTAQAIVHHEVEETACSLHPSRMIVLLTDPRSGAVQGVSAYKNGAMLTRGASLREAMRFRFNPGAVLDSFSPKELHMAGVEDTARVTTSDLAHLYCAVAIGGILRPEGLILIPLDRIESRQHALQVLIQGKKDPILLARVDGMRVAGAAGHGGTNPVTACFAGYFPADHPRHVCIVVIEGADVILKYQRGGLLAAPIFSFVAEKVQRLDHK